MVVLVVVLVVLGVVLEQVEAVAKPLLVPVLKKPPPGPPKPPPGPPKPPPGQLELGTIRNELTVADNISRNRLPHLSGQVRTLSFDQKTVRDPKREIRKRADYYKTHRDSH